MSKHWELEDHSSVPADSPIGALEKAAIPVTMKATAFKLC